MLVSLRLIKSFWRVWLKLRWQGVFPLKESRFLLCSYCGAAFIHYLIKEERVGNMTRSLQTLAFTCDFLYSDDLWIRWQRNYKMLLYYKWGHFNTNTWYITLRSFNNIVLLRNTWLYTRNVTALRLLSRRLVLRQCQVDKIIRVIFKGLMSDE